MKTTSTLIAAIALSSSALSAQTIVYNMDYDTNNSNYSQNDSSAGIKDPNGTFTYNAGTAGVSGTQSLSYVFDSSSLGPADDYQFKIQSARNTTTNAATTDDLSQFTLSFEAFGSSLEASPRDLLVAVAFSGIKSSNTQSFSLVEGTFNTITFSLSDFTFASPLSLAEINGGLRLEVESSYLKAQETFGWDAGNSFALDNVTVTQIPEPSTFASLAGLLALGFAMVRRHS